MQTRFVLTNSNSVYDPNRIYKVNETVAYLGYDYQNTTGRNTVPGIDVNWKLTRSKENYIHDFTSIEDQQDFVIPSDYTLGAVFLNRTFLIQSEYTFSGGILTILETLETGTIISTR